MLPAGLRTVLSTKGVQKRGRPFLRGFVIYIILKRWLFCPFWLRQGLLPLI